MRRSTARRLEGYRRYHVTVGGRRTTATLDKNLSDWLAVRLGALNAPHDTVETEAAQRAVRGWMQAELDRAGTIGRSSVSAWLFARALEAVIDPQLRERAISW